MRRAGGAASHFDRRAAGYARLRDAWPLRVLRREEERAVRELADVRAGQRVLDAGCGAGATLHWLRSAGARCVGVDLSFQMARACRGAGHAVCVQDMERLGFRPVFDWALCIGALEFALDPPGAVRSISGCLRPGGNLILLYPQKNPVGRLYQLYHRSHGVRVRLFAAGEIATLCAGGGFAPPEARIDGRLSSACRAARAS